jgi:hypothetical protein
MHLTPVFDEDDPGGSIFWLGPPEINILGDEVALPTLDSEDFLSINFHTITIFVDVATCL